MTLPTRSRIFCGHFDLKTAPRFSSCDPLASAAGAAFFRPLLGGGGAAVWLEPASGITGSTDGGLETEGCFARDTRAFFAAGGLGILAGSSEAAEAAEALEERRGLARVLFEGIEGSGGIMDGSACWLIDIWDWSTVGRFKSTNSPLRFRFFRTIPTSESYIESNGPGVTKVRQVVTLEVAAFPYSISLQFLLKVMGS